MRLEGIVMRLQCCKVALLMICCSAATFAAEPINIYVSPEGNDNFSGQFANNNRRRSDGPVATPIRARDMVRNLKQINGGQLPAPVNIYFRGGTYWLTAPLNLTPDDSGTAECPVTYMRYGAETPIFSAGRPVRGWDTATLNGHNVWATKIPQLKDAPEVFREMWVDGHRRVLARSPNKGRFVAGDVPDLNGKTPLQEGQTSFHFENDDLKNWPDVADADIVLDSLWAESHLPVASVDEKDHLVTFAVPTIHKMSPKDRYFIEGAAELLDEPGEFYFDRKTGTLYYFPEPSETLLGSQIVIPVYAQVMRLIGSPDSATFVEHVIFRGITFANSEWNIPRSGLPPIPGMKPAGFNQAAWGVPGAIWGDGVHDCIFDNCTISQAGTYGIELGRGCQRNKITHCTMTDLGAGGIKIGETKIRHSEAERTGENEISDCTIADCGKIYPSCIGVWIGQSAGNLISHNDIHGLWYTGISIGWTWGYGDAVARDNIVEFNHVHHIGSPADGIEPVLSDMGAIYTLGKQPGTIIRNNLFHDIAGLRYGGWGIYFDEGSTGIVAENNLVYRTTHGGFHQHYGQDNIVRNNIFAFGRDAQIQRTRVEDHTSFTFERNIVYWDRGNLLNGNWSKFNAVFDNNTYWHLGGEDFKFDKLTWDEWHKAGMDEHSQIRDPAFVDPQHDDFRLKTGAEKDLLGFVPFDVSAVGPRR